MKRWPVDLGSKLAGSGFFYRSSIAHRLSKSQAHRPDTAEILLKRTTNRRSSIPLSNIKNRHTTEQNTKDACDETGTEPPMERHLNSHLLTIGRGVILLEKSAIFINGSVPQLLKELLL